MARRELTEPGDWHFQPLEVRLRRVSPFNAHLAHQVCDVIPPGSGPVAAMSDMFRVLRGDHDVSTVLPQLYVPIATVFMNIL